MTQAAISAALSVVMGMVLGAVYDIIRFLRLLFGFDVRSPFDKKKKRGKWVGYIFVCIGDLLFFIIAAVFMSVFFFLSGDGRMRGYGLFGAFIGFTLYYRTVGRLFIGVSSAVVGFCKRLIKLPFLYFLRLLKKTKSLILKLPIVTALLKRYNIYVDKRKKRALDRLKKNKRKKGGYCSNGGIYESTGTK